MSSPIASSSTSRPLSFGLFDRPTTPAHDVDLEAQLAQPTLALTHIPHTTRASVDETTDAIDDFFGASRPSSPHRARNTSLSGTRDSRHDEVRLTSPVDDPSMSDALPPPYEHSISPPAYSQVSDQPTLAMYLFKFGFLFPLFWVAGALILLSPLSAPADWETSKPELEREELIASMRRTEVKWARRCLLALSVFALIVISLVLGVLFALRA
ncbi:hypothetical protein GSI_04132 [Ganoderma sinense ZZ0214-1]|uniref:Uncharacterized protein n=1 Tax=Ganoderma sinense ZZ0214-1 TaxID=1077348 RepID=A0A2G8SIB0_9APHY|nr:hypothetical protein GSI_04132 [Ganoderma sinense ZZ0214-1]